MVGLLEGKSAWESSKFGINVMMVDVGETGKDPRLHANALFSTQDPPSAVAIAMQLAEENWESGNEALAVHAWGDIATEGGVYFPGFEDPLASLWHYIEDAFKPGSFEKDIKPNILRKSECVKGKGKPSYLQFLLQILFHPF